MNHEEKSIYMQLNKEVKKVVIERKNEEWNRKCEEVERLFGGIRISQAWKIIKNIRKERKETKSISLIGGEE